jgi:hypothetical protein
MHKEGRRQRSMMRCSQVSRWGACHHCLGARCTHTWCLGPGSPRHRCGLLLQLSSWCCHTTAGLAHMAIAHNVTPPPPLPWSCAPIQPPPAHPPELVGDQHNGCQHHHDDEQRHCQREGPGRKQQRAHLGQGSAQPTWGEVVVWVVTWCGGGQQEYRLYCVTNGL